MASRVGTDLFHPDVSTVALDQVLDALGDPARLAIVSRLQALEPDAELPCGAFDLGLSKSTQSGHFRVLRKAGVIRQRDQGTRRLNSLRRDDLDAHFPGLLELVRRDGRPSGR